MSLSDAEQYRLQSLVRKHESEIQKLKDQIERLLKMHGKDAQTEHPYVDTGDVW